MPVDWQDVAGRCLLDELVGSVVTALADLLEAGVVGVHLPAEGLNVVVHDPDLLHAGGCAGHGDEVLPGGLARGNSEDASGLPGDTHSLAVLTPQEAVVLHNLLRVRLAPLVALTAQPAWTSLPPSSRPIAYSGAPVGVRALPKTLTARGSSASRPNPSTNSAWMRSTRHGSVWTQSDGPRTSSSRSSVVLACTCPRRRVTGPRCFSGVSLRSGSRGSGIRAT